MIDLMMGMMRMCSFLVMILDHNRPSAIILATQLSTILRQDGFDLNNFFWSCFNGTMSGIVHLITGEFWLIDVLI